MTFDVTVLCDKVRIAIDEIVDQGTDSSFDNILDREIYQAIDHAVLQLCQELPVDVMEAKNADVQTVQTEHGDGPSDDGTGVVLLPADFLRLVKFKLASWNRAVRELTDPLSDEAKMQASKWTRGNPQKPKAMLGGSKTVTEGEGNEQVSAVHRLMEYYAAGLSDATNPPSYNHTVENFSYIPRPSKSDNNLSTPLQAEFEPYIIYRAAGIVMEGKQHGDLADRFYKLSMINSLN